MTYIIERNIPFPHKELSGDFPFAQMQIGDSFLLNGALPQTVGYVAAVFARRQEPKWKFTVRKTPIGYRCWRVL